MSRPFNVNVLTSRHKRPLHTALGVDHCASVASEEVHVVSRQQKPSLSLTDAEQHVSTGHGIPMDYNSIEGSKGGSKEGCNSEHQGLQKVRNFPSFAEATTRTTTRIVRSTRTYFTPDSKAPCCHLSFLQRSNPSSACFTTTKPSSECWYAASPQFHLQSAGHIRDWLYSRRIWSRRACSSPSARWKNSCICSYDDVSADNPTILECDKCDARLRFYLKDFATNTNVCPESDGLLKKK